MKTDGKWRVIGKSGGLQFLFGDIKYIKGCRGYNRIFGIKWGRFVITREGGEIVFTYANGKIVDKVVFIDDNKLFGRFYLDETYVGTFEMERIK